MLSLKTILHPTDFSEHSRDAFELACALARDHKARLVLLHVVTPTAELLPTSGIVAPPSLGFVEEMGRELSKIKPTDPTIVVDRRVEQGDASTMIQTVAEETDADLIVMGTHGRTGLSRFLMGSVSEWVLRQAPCPVVTVRNPIVALKELEAEVSSTE